MSNETTVKIIENVIVLEVNNLLEGWPAYVINFTPEDTGPHKIILHLRNPSKYVTLDTDDEDEDPGAPPSEYKRLTTISDARIMVPTPRRDGPSQPYESPEESSDDGDDESSSGEQTPSVTVDAIPVNLNGIPHDIVPKKRKFFDEAWPPRRPRAFRSISANSSIASYEAFLTFPAAVKAAPEDTCRALDGETAAGNDTAVKN
ncbi:hypothetical protein EDC04DRAFT_2896781 [Pisolithus marmoratus]|nr:hypothetical protein EDC04DRAFT_2896781 [Pisolithus marmoratus]